jgi:hypothetical protein
LTYWPYQLDEVQNGTEFSDNNASGPAMENHAADLGAVAR